MWADHLVAGAGATLQRSDIIENAIERGRHHCLRSCDRINVIVAGKQPAPQWLDIVAS